MNPYSVPADFHFPIILPHRTLLAMFLKIKNYEATKPKTDPNPKVFGNPEGGIPAETLTRIERQLNRM